MDYGVISTQKCSHRSLMPCYAFLLLHIENHVWNVSQNKKFSFCHLIAVVLHKHNLLLKFVGQIFLKYMHMLHKVTSNNNVYNIFKNISPIQFNSYFPYCYFLPRYIYHQLLSPFLYNFKCNVDKAIKGFLKKNIFSL